ncbi:hypothetical protein AN958_08573 [Leucoagaricus sp. SymC.cos]|nr:hypothetical protein AN958_08573 [Leucoagaricus sp. SymC.cos]
MVSPCAVFVDFAPDVLTFSTRTPNYTDNVLNSKISALITGAINRAAVEKEPTITYEEFANELDTGDAFTTSLIDVLVKELAERHTRPSQNDERRLIASRTAERLMSLANPRQVYRGERSGNRNHAGRRTYNLAEFINLPASEMDLDEEENDFGNLLDSSTGAVEGARFNTDLFEAYGSQSWSPISRRLGTTPSPPLEDEPPFWRPHGTLSSTGRSSTWTTAIPTTSATSLTRHPSIRRPARSRMVDFHDWTSRRRSSIRDSLGAQAEGSDSNSSLSLGNSNESAQTVRRFFPTVTRRLERRSEPRDDRSGGEEGRPVFTVEREPSPVQAGGSESRSNSGTSNALSEYRPLPRLRRGGVQPPETFYAQRFPWSAPSNASRSTELPADLHSAARSPSPNPVQPLVPTPPPVRDDTTAASTELVGYPTPGSIDNEPASV